jgi:hypothetical protein
MNALRAILAFAIAWAAALLAVSPGHAQSASRTSFDHFSTGFPLSGAHSGVDCGSCHVNGRFKGTPRACASCHNGTIAQGKINRHPQTTNLCDQCHVTVAWSQVRVDHAGIMNGCASCHNGTTALGKPANHLATNAPCETCHKSTVSYAGATFDHRGITAGCATCHNGSSASTLTTPPHIPTGMLECNNCHTSTTTWTGYRMNHTATSAIACTSCHSGSFVGEGTSGAQSKGPSHVATTANCATCHTSTTTWAGAAFNHAGITAGCAACHNGATATGLTTPPHIPTATLECSNCHTNTSTFTTATMNHAAVGGIACGTRHPAAYPDRNAGMQQLPYQHVELDRLHDEALGRERDPVRVLSQRVVYQPGHGGRARQGTNSPRHHGGLRNLPQEHDFLGGGDFQSCRHQQWLRSLPQRQRRDRPDHAAAHPDRGARMQQLPHQYDDLHRLFDESRRGELDRVQLLP